jgi:hypothetical protein
MSIVYSIVYAAVYFIVVLSVVHNYENWISSWNYQKTAKRRSKFKLAVYSSKMFKMFKFFDIFTRILQLYKQCDHEHRTTLLSTSILI